MSALVKLYRRNYLILFMFNVVKPVTVESASLTHSRDKFARKKKEINNVT